MTSRQITTDYHTIIVNDLEKVYSIGLNISSSSNEYIDFSADSKIKNELDTLQREGYRSIYLSCECGCTIV